MISSPIHPCAIVETPTSYTKYLLPVSRCRLSSFIRHPKNMHSSGVCS